MKKFLKNITGFSLPIIGGGFSWKNDKNLESEKTNASFVFYGDHRTPDPIKLENIFRWYTLQNITRNLSDEKIIHKNWIIFLVFDRPVNNKHIKVKFSSKEIPIYEVKDFSQRSAIIIINNEIPSGVVEIELEE